MIGTITVDGTVMSSATYAFLSASLDSVTYSNSTSLAVTHDYWAGRLGADVDRAGG